MRIIFIALSFFFFAFLCGYSQLSWNVKAGMNLSKTTNEDTNMKPGYQLGMGADYFFNDCWGIQSSLILISKGFKNKGDYLYPPGWNAPAKTFDKTENRIYIELPVMLAYRLSIAKNVNLILNGGAYISYGIVGKHKNKITLEDGSKANSSLNIFSNGYEKFDTGLGAGTTIEYKKKYTVGLMGEWGLKGVTADSKNQTYGLNLGYKF